MSPAAPLDAPDAPDAAPGGPSPPALLQPAWTPPPRVGAAMSTRNGGVSTGSWHSLNLGLACDDRPEAVAENRRRFATALGATPVWLRQVHGCGVLHLADGRPRDEPADAAWTTQRGVACTVLVADCLPVLFSRDDGAVVAAAHAGWRGLAAGVLEATVGALADRTGTPPQRLRAWLGPCIGAQAFEVGVDVLQAFGATPARPGRCFVPRPRADGSARWLADLPALARARLLALGLSAAAVHTHGGCTVASPSAFFSYRRDGRASGRMAAAIWRD
jgi:polyphenol oxidase